MGQANAKSCIAGNSDACSGALFILIESQSYLIAGAIGQASCRRHSAQFSSNKFGFAILRYPIEVFQSC
jgi:hypothetical protein